MGLKQDIIDKVTGIVDGAFTVTNTSSVPDIGDSRLTFGNTGLLFKATVLYIDMRGSTKILHKHNRTTVSKIHMAYFHTVVKIAGSLGGEVRSFNGDSLLVFFQGDTTNRVRDAVKAAMKIKYMLTDSTVGINSILAKYSAIDFGIGLDYGNVLCTKVGVGGNSNNQDLFWVGQAVNKSVIISDNCKASSHIGISEMVRVNLLDEVKYSSGNDMWSPSIISYNDSNHTIYKTSYHWVVS
jgi:adenylate cyclase